MKHVLPIIRLTPAPQVSIEVFSVHSASDANVVARILRIEPPEAPALVVAARTVGNLAWARIVAGMDLSWPFVCASYSVVNDMLAVGYGRMVDIYGLRNLCEVSKIATPLPVHALIYAGPSTDGSLVVVTELSVSMYSANGELRWEYWHPEPIEQSWSEGESISLSDFVHDTVHLDMSTGMPTTPRAT